MMTSLMRQTVLLLGLVLVMLLPAWADIYVANRPYEGSVRGSYGDERVMLAEIAQALGLEIGQSDQGWTLGGSYAPTIEEDGEVWVSLSALPSEVVRTVEHRALGIIDLYRLGSTMSPETVDWGGKGTVVYFYADWSPACVAMENSISMLERATNIEVKRLNIDTPRSSIYRDHVRLFQGDEIPFYALIDENGRRITSFSGFFTYNELLEKVREAYSF